MVLDKKSCSVREGPINGNRFDKAPKPKNWVEALKHHGISVDSRRLPTGSDYGLSTLSANRRSNLNARKGSGTVTAGCAGVVSFKSHKLRDNHVIREFVE